MDKYNLRISLVNSSNGSNLKSIIDKCKCPNRLLINCNNTLINDTKTYNLSDIIIIDSSISAEEMSYIISNINSYCKIVLADTIMLINTLDEKILSKLSNIWITDSEKLLSFSIEAFLSNMLDCLDKELAEKQLDTLIDSVPDLIWFKDIIGAHIKVNNSFCETVNKTKEQIKYRGHCYIWDLDMEEYEQGEFICMETEEVVIDEQGTFLFDEKVKIGDSMRQLKTYKSAILGRNGETIGTVGLARDVTEIWNTHEEFQTIINTLPFPMIITNKDYEILNGNKEFYDNFSEKENSVVGSDIDLFGFKHFNYSLSFKDCKRYSVEKHVTINNQNKTFIIEKSEIQDVFKETTGYFYTFRDITIQREYEERLKILSIKDELTKLDNRKAIRLFLDNNMGDIISNKKSLSIILMDLDCFKGYNDMYGHIMGDNALIEFASILKTFEHEKDICVARYGGEEFIILVKNKKINEVENIIKYINNQLANKKIVHNNSSVSNILTISTGMAYFEELILNNPPISHLIEKADKELYRAKDNGRNQYSIYIDNDRYK